MERALAGQVAVVTGATRGAGRGTACELGSAGATVYCTGAALAADPEVRRFAGQTLSSWQLAKEYGFDDVDGSHPDWGSYMQEHILGQGS